MVPNGRWTRVRRAAATRGKFGARCSSARFTDPSMRVKWPAVAVVRRWGAIRKTAKKTARRAVRKAPSRQDRYRRRLVPTRPSSIRCSSSRNRTRFPRRAALVPRGSTPSKNPASVAPNASKVLLILVFIHHLINQ